MFAIDEAANVFGAIENLFDARTTASIKLIPAQDSIRSALDSQTSKADAETTEFD